MVVTAQNCRLIIVAFITPFQYRPLGLDRDSKCTTKISPLWGSFKIRNYRLQRFCPYRAKISSLKEPVCFFGRSGV